LIIKFDLLRKFQDPNKENSIAKLKIQKTGAYLNFEIFLPGASLDIARLPNVRTSNLQISMVVRSGILVLGAFKRSGVPYYGSYLELLLLLVVRLSRIEAGWKIPVWSSSHYHLL